MSDNLVATDCWFKSSDVDLLNTERVSQAVMFPTLCPNNFRVSATHLDRPGTRSLIQLLSVMILMMLTDNYYKKSR